MPVFARPLRGNVAQGNRDKRSLSHLTIKQLREATQDHPDDNFRVDQAELFQVRIVGLILSANEQTTNVTYTVSDGTGTVDVKYWLDEASGENPLRQQCVEGVWIAAEGNLRDYEGQRHVLAFHVRPIQDANEIPHHFLQSVLVHCERTRGSLASKMGSMSVSAGQSMGNPSLGYQQQPQQQQQQQGSGNALVDRVHNVVKEQGRFAEQGVNIQSVFERMKGEGVSFQQVSEAMNFLTGEGLVFTTVDDNHFKSTESFY